MTGKTHIVGGITAALAVSAFTSYDPLIVSAAGAAGALLPDICHGGSKIGRKAPLLSRLINLLFGHRTFTHSLLFLFLLELVMAALIPYRDIQIGISAGVISHLILDAATKKGIKLLYPLDVSIKFPVTIRTGGPMEKAVMMALIITALYFSREIMI